MDTSQIRLTPELKFCIQFLKNNNILTGESFERCVKKVKDAPLQYRIVKAIPKTFFTDLATQMRDLWPLGLKEGKWEWRGPVDELADRLEWLWKERGLENYTIDDVLLVCRDYVSSPRFSTNKTYMKTLRYFIYRSGDVKQVTKDGRLKMNYTSELGDMLIRLTDEERQAEKQAKEMESAPIDYGGELI